MATELPRDIDAQIVNLLTRISSIRDGNIRERTIDRRQSMSNEMRSLEFWRAVAVECFATFLFVLVVLGAAGSSNVYGSGLSVLATSIASGFAIAAIYLIFGHISGGHVNPAVSISFALSRRISILRAGFYLVAQCGGGLAGAAMLYGVNGAQAMPPAANRNIHGTDKILLVEMSLSVLIVLAYLKCESVKKIAVLGSSKPAGVLAAAYTAATLVSNPYLNPARALGPAFVTNRWDNQWVYWVGPIAGGALAAMIHEYVLSPKRSRSSHDMDDIESSSMRSDEDPYDDLDKQTGPKYPGGYATYRPVAGASSIYSPPPSAIERVESIYGGTKSLYCKSPPLTRANLNRSQSVYAKSSASGRDGFIIPKPGPLVPAQSLYQMRIGQSNMPGPTTREQQPITTSITGQNITQQPTQNHNSTNQNMQNQLQQCTQSIYGIRGVSTSVSTRENGIYGVTSSSIYGRAPAPPPPPPPVISQSPQGPSSQINQQVQQQQQQQVQQVQQQQQQQQQQQHQQQQQPEASGSVRRPESMYGHVSRRSDDSAYGSYQGSSRGNYGKIPGPPPPSGWSHHSEQNRPSPVAGPLQQNHNQQSNYQRNSPNPQY